MGALAKEGWVSEVVDVRRRPGLAVLGTGSDVGKSTLVAGLCRVLADLGVAVAPFKAQNMALNSAVTEDGGEIGRAQALQAAAARVPVEVSMNPVLLKPTDDRRSQVVVLGRAQETMGVREYYRYKASLRPVVEGALEELRSRFDVVLVEGAGSTAEINLLENDFTNIVLAHRMGIPAILVGDIERGGVFASIYGTLGLLPAELSEMIRGYVINKFRGDPSLLESGITQLGTLTGRPCLGVVPFSTEAAFDAEDSLGLGQGSVGSPGGLDVAVVVLPRISNFTDFDPFRCEPDLTLRWVRHPQELGTPDLVVLPGSKATVSDLEWCRATGWLDALAAHRQEGGYLLGVCGGYQMLGECIVDPIESGRGELLGLGWLPVRTAFHPDKVVRRCTGSSDEVEFEGYQIHHGRVEPRESALVWTELVVDGETIPEGVCDQPRRCFGTTVHGIMESDQFRTAFLSEIARGRSKRYHPAPLGYGRRREEYLDRLADSARSHLDLEGVWHLMNLDLGERERKP
jgi:adenosylcobyric acid synthase